MWTDSRNDTLRNVGAAVGSANIEHDIADHFAALAEFVGRGNVAQRQAPSDGVDEPVALQERAELGEAGVAIGNAEIVNKKKRNVIELRMFNLRCADP